MSLAVFATQDYQYLREALCRQTGFMQGAMERHLFPDGERGVRILQDVKDHDVVLIGGTGTDAQTLELYDLACGLVNQGVHTLSLVVPYFGYSTQERAERPGEKAPRFLTVSWNIPLVLNP